MKIVLRAFLAFLLSASAAHAGGALSDSVSAWFKNWKQGLEKSAVEGRYRHGRTTSVAAVRGAPQKEDVTKPYWKGGVSEAAAKQSLAERKELSAAVDLVLAGKKDEARKAFDAFETAHPKSIYLADLRQAREKLGIKAAASEPASPAAK